ncbi:hypothetical protein H920_13219 [Fukomys damarensis]|uniref:Cation channel sperm-associated protein subunit epsilon n=1 Tax=Fukomys damarensis TaxID=885580 RepID=A0A091D4M1_FUKDA|nr:hypothetical protein H920_13219 [Fukomys damarensis]
MAVTPGVLLLLLELSCGGSALWRYSSRSPHHHIISTRSAKGEEERYLPVDTTYICFLWYYTVINIFENLTQVVSIWVYDPEYADSDELLWQAEVPSLKKEGAGGPGRDGTSLNTSVISLHYLSPLFLAMKGPDMPVHVVVVTDMETFQTNDSFSTWTRVTVPPNILSDAERHNVDSVLLLRDSIYFLINGVLYLKDTKELTKLGREKHLPEGEILGITSRRWCWIKYIIKNVKVVSSIAIWTEDEIYFGYSENKFVKIITTAELKSLLNLPPSGTLTIHNIDYTGHPLELAVLLNYCITCTNTKKIYIVIYNEDSMQWVPQDFVLDVPIASFFIPRFLLSGMPELILWDKHKVYYSYQNFTTTGVLQTSAGHGNLSALSKDSVIHDIYVDSRGNIVTKMENNIMFYSKSNTEDALKLHLWTSDTIKSSFCVSASAQVYLVYVFDNGTIQLQEYPLMLELQSVAFKMKEKCPYMMFHDNVLDSFYFLDKGDSLRVWVEIIYPENTGLDIIVKVYGPQILEYEESFHYEVASGYCTNTLTMTFYSNVNYEGVDDYFNFEYKNMGNVFVQLRPSQHSNVCPVTQKVSDLGSGKQYLRNDATTSLFYFSRFSKTACVHHEFFYEIDKSHLRHKPLENLKVRYDWEKYGCPLRLNGHEKFQPLIQLFDDSGHVDDVAVNFILWEIHGRNDYSYNNTMKQSGCLNEAQTWKTMIELNADLPLEEVWGPENYRSCFSYAIGKPGDLDQPYEIINISNNNHIFWPLHHSGMYVFRVKILDPNYSFCNLTAIFAIEIFGVIPRPSGYLVSAIVFVMMLLFISILVLSYFQYTKLYQKSIYKPYQKIHIKQKTY